MVSHYDETRGVAVVHVFVRFPEPKQIGRRLRPLCSARAKLSNTLPVGKRVPEHQTYVNGARFVDFLEMFLIILLGSRWPRALQLTTGSSVVVFASLLISNGKKKEKNYKQTTFENDNVCEKRFWTGQDRTFSTVFFGRAGRGRGGAPLDSSDGRTRFAHV